MKKKSLYLFNFILLYSCKLYSQNAASKFGFEYENSFLASAKARELSKYYIQICPNPEGYINYTEPLLYNFEDNNLQSYLNTFSLVHILKKKELDDFVAKGMDWKGRNLPLVIITCTTHNRVIGSFFGSGKPAEIKEILELYKMTHLNKYPHN